MPTLPRMATQKNVYVKLLLLLWAVQCLLGHEYALAQAPQMYRVVLLGNTYCLPKAWARKELDSAAVMKQLEAAFILSHEKGYLEAAADSMLWLGKQAEVQISCHCGPQYKWAMLDTRQVPSKWLYEAGYTDRWQQEPISPATLVRLQQKLVALADAEGYAFAQARLDSMVAGAATRGQLGLKAKLLLLPGPQIRFDTLQLVGNAQIQTSWLESYLRMVPGMPYSTARVMQANQALKQFNWLTVNQPIQVQFLNRIAQPLLRAEKRNASQIDGIIGFLPNEVNPGQVLVTGELKLQLYNLFKTGKTLLLDWQSIKPENQRLNVRYEHPQLLGLPLEPVVVFNLLREDSSFLNRNARLQLNYRYANGLKLGAFVGSVASQILLRQPAADGGNGLAGTDMWQYGLSTSWQNVDDALYPHKGFTFMVEGSLAQKSMRAPVNALPAWRDSLASAGLQYQLNVRAEYFQPWGSRWVWYQRLNAATLVNNRLVRNELFRLGGLQSLRGFNENYFFGSTYGIYTSELRWFLDATTFLSAFTDWAMVQERVLQTTRTDTPFGLGLGVHFTTGAGVFSIQYALGQDRGQRLSLETSKLHVGVAARF